MSNSMQEFRIEKDALSERRASRIRLLSWGVVFLLFAAPVLIFTLALYDVLRFDSNLRWLGWVSAAAIMSAAIGSLILAFREALRRAERQMVFVLDDVGIARKRKGFPDVRIAFSEVDYLGEELRWLVVKSTEPLKKIAIPNNVKGYEVIRAEIAKHHALAPPIKKFPLKSIALATALPTISVLSWAGVLWFRDIKFVVAAAAIAITLLAIASRRLWIVLRRGPKRLFSLAYLGCAWLVTILLIYFRVVRS